MALQRQDFTLVRGARFHPLGDMTAKFGLKVIIDVQHDGSSRSEWGAPPGHRLIADLPRAIWPNHPGWVS